LKDIHQKAKHRTKIKKKPVSKFLSELELRSEKIEKGEQPIQQPTQHPIQQQQQAKQQPIQQPTQHPIQQQQQVKQQPIQQSNQPKNRIFNLLKL